MEHEFRHFAVSRDERDVVTVSLDVQGYPVNVFSDEVIGELGRIVGQLEHEERRAVVFRSGKAAGFLAGADVRRIQQIETAEEAGAAVDAGRQLFERIARLPCPTIAVIHGLCLGGGLEFALACRYRVARNDPSTRLGLPEIQLGLIPGWGGTQRLPRLIGLRAALRMILEGTKLSATEALQMGLVDKVVASGDGFKSEVEQFVIDRLAGKPIPKARGRFTTLLDTLWAGRWLIFRAARKKIASRRDQYPALSAALAVIETGLRRAGAGMTAEKKAFVHLLFTETARNLLELFFQRERAGKPNTWVQVDKAALSPIRRIAVLGAGTMGAGIAQLAALQGYQVVLKEINGELAVAGKKRVETLMDEAVKKGVVGREEADTGLRAVTATSDWPPVDNVDLVIEAVVEREEIKRQVFRELSDRLPATTILATNTSSLTVERVTSTASHRERVCGLHFFNPVHKMQLVEVVRGRDTDDRTIGMLVEWVRRLGKVAVVVADGPGFLVNRILFPYLDEAVRLLEEGHTVKVIDRAAVKFGMPMGPLELLDQVGLDIAADVAQSLIVERGTSSPTPERLALMVKKGWLGRKSGQGFYAYANGRKGKPISWETSNGAVRTSSDRSRSGLDFFQRRLIYPMVNESAHCLETGVAESAWVIDLAMVLGTGFAPFRGGPLRCADTWGVETAVGEMEELGFEPCSLLKSMAGAHERFYPSGHAPARAGV